MTSTLAGCLNIGPDPRERIKNHIDELSRYRDVSKALSDGYRTSAEYVKTSRGTLGIPFINFNIRRLDPNRPQILLFNLTKEGEYELMGVKWYRPIDAVNNSPTLFGKKFRGPQESQVSIIPRHYGLTAWIFQNNPNGIFARYNPSVAPVSLVSKIGEVRDTLREFSFIGEARKKGYVNSENCIELDRGLYGVPFIDPELVQSGGMKPSHPPILLYRITSSWSYRLLGVEWYQPVTEVKSPPTLFGMKFHKPMGSHSPEVEQPRHYGLHAWLFAANPNGMFSPYHPLLNC